MKLLAALASLVTGLAVSAVALSAGAASPSLGGCPVFPATSVWNQRVDALPVESDSAQLISSIGLDSSVHADFGSGLYNGSSIGIPYVVLHGKTTPKSRVKFDYSDESDKGPYPIPSNVPIEGYPHSGDGDRHALIVDRDTCRLYELYALRRSGAGWAAGSGAIWNLRSNALRPAGWTSADAAGLPILPGLARWTTPRPAGSTMRFASPRRARGTPTSTRRATRRAVPPTRRSRRWAFACA